MMNSSKNQCRVKPGTIIEGKWHKNRYSIIKELGYGANGIVYLAKGFQNYVALKMSDNGMSITSEVNVLKSFAKVQGSALGPSLLDVDDWQQKDGTISFYVMEYIKGPNFMDYMEQKGSSWLPVLTLQLLTDLENLHRNGWVFGDLKPENLIVTGPPARIRCIDVGGTTLEGRAIKEFTEFFDRGYWGLGSRKADPTYDLFAVAMIMINTAYPKRFSKTTGGMDQLQQAIKQSRLLLKFESVMVRALHGKYQSASEMRSELLRVISLNSNVTQNQTRSTRQSRQSTNRAVYSQKSSATPRQSTTKRKAKSGLLETFFICMIVFFFYIFYIYTELI